MSWIQIVRNEGGKRDMKSKDDVPLSVDEYAKKVGSIQGPAIDENEQIWQNPYVGYADAYEALEKIAQLAASKGVKRISCDAKKIIVNSERRCVGITTQEGYIPAAATILCTGPWTPNILKESGIPYPRGFFATAGVHTALLEPDERDRQQYMSMPILVTDDGMYFVNRSLSYSQI